MMATGLNAYPQVRLENFAPPSAKKSLHPQSDKYHYHVIDNSFQYSEPSQKAASRKSEAKTVNVQFFLDKERPEYGWNTLHVYDVIAGKNIYSHQFDPSNCPVGTYDFILGSQVKAGGTAFVIKENVEVKNDTSIIFNLSEAKNKISIEIYKRDGELSAPCIYEEKEDGYNIIDEGDPLSIYWAVGRIGGGPLLISNCFNQRSVDEVNPDCTFFVNDASDNYAITYMGYFDDGDCCMFANGTNGMKEQVLQNKAEGYVWYNEQFALPPTFDLSKNEGCTKILQYLLNNGIEAILLEYDNKLSEDGKVGFYVNHPEAEGKAYMLVSPRLGIHQQTIVGEYIGYDENGNQVPVTYTSEVMAWLAGAPAKVTKTDVEYIVKTNSATANTVNERGEKLSLYPGPTAFSVQGKKKKGMLGDNCPVTAVYIDNGIMPNQDVKSSNIIDFVFRGRYGEVREDVYEGLEETIKLDGEMIVNGITNNWLLGQKTTGIEQGVFDVELINGNIYVDGLQGRNVVTMQYDANREDWTPPVLTMVQFRDTEDDVTDRFSNAEQGILTFSAGDKEFHAEPSYGWGYYTIGNDMTVEVSYSPYNKNVWQTLEGIEEVSEYYYYPDYGYFYRGSLAGVTAESENGWFDLKIRLVDASGNWQEQTISPAFHVDALTTVGIMGSQINRTIPTEHYAVDGRRLLAPHPGLNLVKGSDGTVRKVMVQ